MNGIATGYLGLDYQWIVLHDGELVSDRMMLPLKPRVIYTGSTVQPNPFLKFFRLGGQQLAMVLEYSDIANNSSYHRYRN